LDSPASQSVTPSATPLAANQNRVEADQANRKQRRAAAKKAKRAIITPAIINANPVIPAKAGIQNTTGCRIKSGMTTFDMFTCRSNNKSGQFPQMSESAAPQPVPAPTSEEIEHLVTLFNQRCYAEAETLARKITERFPTHGFGWKALGAIHKLQGRSAESLAPMQKAAELLPEDAEAHSNLGVTLQEQGRLTDAEASHRRALEIKPDYAVAHSNLGNTLQEQGRLAEAEASHRRALEIKPDYAEAHSNLGNSLREQGRLTDAEASYRRALEIKLDYAEAHSNLGNSLREQGRLADAELSYRRALEIKPDNAEAHSNLGVALQEQGRLTDADASYRWALEIKPDFAEAHSNLLFAMGYTASHHLSDYLEEARRYGQMASRKVGERFSAWLCEAQPERLKVGLVSGDLRNHPVGYFLESILTQIDPSRIELIAYPTDHKADELTARIKPYFSAWKSLVGLSDEAAARLIHADGVHLLLDLAGHTAKNRLPVFVWKPAPVQASWLGYIATTGVTEMDYLLADATGVPESLRGQFVEAVWYLPDTRLCFTVPNADVPVSDLPALGRGYLTFGCFQNLAKIGDRVLNLWGKILAAIPDARLRLQCKQLSDPAMQERLMQRLMQHGIAPDRVFLQGVVSREAYLAAHAEVDMILDTFPYPGGTTTCEGLWMGVPTLTLSGDRMLSRQGASLLTAAGLEDWIADSEEDYVSMAVSLGNNLPQLASLRKNLRNRLLASPLCDAPRFARHLEAALWGMWER